MNDASHPITAYFLARAGRVAGPYTEADLRTLEARGELMNYSWVWAPGASDWKPLDPKPTARPSMAPPQNASSRAASDEALPMEAYALWGQSAIRGRVRSRTELGFELVYAEEGLLPTLASGMSVQVMQAPGDATAKASLAFMKIAEIRKNDGEWVLFLRHA